MTQAVLRLIAPLATLAYCGSFLAGELQLLLYGWRTRRWALVPGTILHSEVRTGPAPVAWGRGSTVLHYPSVIYQYRVGGTLYHGSHLGYCGGWSPVRWSAPWKAGDQVQVCYDPTQPSNAVLRSGISSANVLGVLLGLVALALTLWWLGLVAGAA